MELLPLVASVIGETMDNYVGRHRWSLDKQPGVSGVYLTIDYPKPFEITNSDGDLHTIEGLRVLVPFERDGREDRIKVKGNYIYGYRSHISVPELQCSHRHSHLPSQNYDSPDYVNDFCLGDGGGPIKMAMMECNMDFDTLKFEVLLLQIERFIAWESIEGGPYCHIRDISWISNDESTYQASKNDEEKIIQLFKAGEIELPLYYTTSGQSRTCIQLDETSPQFINLMDEHTCYKGHVDLRGVFTRRVGHLPKLKQYLRYKREMNKTVYFNGDGEEYVAIWKGKPVIQHLLPFREFVREVDDRPLVAHPHIIHSVGHSINQTLKRESYGKEEEIKQEVAEQRNVITSGQDIGSYKYSDSSSDSNYTYIG